MPDVIIHCNLKLYVATITLSLWHLQQTLCVCVCVCAASKMFGFLSALHLFEKTFWCSFHPCICDLIVPPHVWMTTQPHTHKGRKCVCGVRVSALWVFPAWGWGWVVCARKQMVVTGWEGGRAQRQWAQWECCCLSCGLGWVRTSKILMQGFSSSLEQTLHYSYGRKSCTRSTMLMENGRQPFAGLLFKYFT